MLCPHRVGFCFLQFLCDLKSLDTFVIFPMPDTGYHRYTLYLRFWQKQASYLLKLPKLYDSFKARKKF